MDDVESILAVSGHQLDWDYIHRWAEEHKTQQLLDDLRDNLPESDDS